MLTNMLKYKMSLCFMGYVYLNTTWLIHILQPRLKLRWSRDNRHSHLRRESDPKMLPTEQETKWKKTDGKMTLKIKKKGKRKARQMQRLDCLFEQQFPLHWCQIAVMDCKKKKKIQRRKKSKGSRFTSGQGSCCRWTRPSPASSPSRSSAWRHQQHTAPAQPLKSPDGQHWKCQTLHRRKRCPHHLRETNEDGTSEQLNKWHWC